ncbi:peptidase M23B [Tepidicaulis marinus]|uniref:Peptidase M23B n=1 Tax=Tepidicaulis marinus TaxID=1333998 RepID=A0A081B8F0_9HYPH|nr:peptidoglycan DD-metalloendopeptidase family protein [Tepidicaulis marinus]GAK44318.1 peptidase M23B [Tepidicaulis marinus]
MPRFRHKTAGSRSLSLLTAGAFAVLAFHAAGSGASAQERAPDPEALQSIEKELGTAKERQVMLEAQAEELRAEVAKLRAQLIKAAARVQAREEDVTLSEDRLTGLVGAEAVLRAQLSARRKDLAETLAALQRLDRNPPPALAVKPDDALGAMRSAMVLGTLVPQLEAEAREIRARLDELRRVRQDILAERETLSDASGALAAEQQELERLLSAKLTAQAELDERLETEREEVARLSQEARTLSELIEKLEARAAHRLPEARPVRPSARLQAPASKPLSPAEAGPEAPADEDRQLASLPSGRPLISGQNRLFSKARGQIRLPAHGEITKIFGENDGAGGRNRGLSLKTRPDAQITAPFDGKIVFAGPFRRYGQLLILSVGEGYHLLFAGLERIDTQVGQQVLAGEPLGQMAGSEAKNAALKGNVKPTLYIEFRKDGEPIDPKPWFALSERKARG